MYGLQKGPSPNNVNRTHVLSHRRNGPQMPSESRLTTKLLRANHGWVLTPIPRTRSLTRYSGSLSGQPIGKSIECELNVVSVAATIFFSLTLSRAMTMQYLSSGLRFIRCPKTLDWQSIQTALLSDHILNFLPVSRIPTPTDSATASLVMLSVLFWRVTKAHCTILLLPSLPFNNLGPLQGIISTPINGKPFAYASNPLHIAIKTNVAAIIIGTIKEGLSAKNLAISRIIPGSRLINGSTIYEEIRPKCSLAMTPTTTTNSTQIC